jgi:hypothetical protein
MTPSLRRYSSQVLRPRQDPVRQLTRHLFISGRLHAPSHRRRRGGLVVPHLQTTGRSSEALSTPTEQTNWSVPSHHSTPSSSSRVCTLALVAATASTLATVTSDDNAASTKTLRACLSQETPSSPLSAAKCWATGSAEESPLVVSAASLSWSSVTTSAGFGGGRFACITHFAHSTHSAAASALVEVTKHQPWVSQIVSCCNA